MAGLVVVCGLRAEAEIARGDDPTVSVIAGGGDATRILAQLDERRPDTVLSFGLAGGLAPGFGPGTARLAEAVVDGAGRRYPANAPWTSAMRSALNVATALFVGVDAPLANLEDKAAAYRTIGAELVDMESHVVAAWATRRGAAFAALRVVSDPAERSLPQAAAVGMKPGGAVDVSAVLLSLVKDPRQFPALIRTGLDARAAFATLLRCRQRLGPSFARLDL